MGDPMDSSCVLTVQTRLDATLDKLQAEIDKGAARDKSLVSSYEKSIEEVKDELKMHTSTLGPSDAWCDEYKRDMVSLRALIGKPTIISTTALHAVGDQVNKESNVLISLALTDALTWDSPVCAQVTSSSVQLLEADKGGQKELQTLFADLLPTATINTPFVFYDVHTKPSVCGSDLKPDVVMGLRDKPCIPLTTAAIMNFKRQGGGYDNDENIGKAITYRRVFL